MKHLNKSTKALFAFTFALLLLAGGYGTVLAQKAEQKDASQTDKGGMMACCEEGATMQEMMQNCPMMKDGAMMGPMMQNCPMMQGMMQQDGMMDDRDAEGEQSSKTYRGTSAAAEAAPVQPTAAATTSHVKDDVQVVEITIGPNGYEPKQVELEAGLPARLIFTRTTDTTCAKQIQAPDFGIEKTELPLHEPVTVEFTPEEDGTFTFACGMDMMKGTILVKS